MTAKGKAPRHVWVVVNAVGKVVDARGTKTELADDALVLSDDTVHKYVLAPAKKKVGSR